MKRKLLTAVLLILAAFLLSCGPKEFVTDVGACPVLAILPVVVALIIRR